MKKVLDFYNILIHHLKKETLIHANLLVILIDPDPDLDADLDVIIDSDPGSGPELEII